MSAPIRQSGFVGDLCVALRHRWLPNELFVIFTAYFDESGTHGPAPTVTMAGFLGHTYQWRRFETKLARLQKQHRFKVFHAKHFKQQRGEFEGWSDAKCVQVIEDLTELVKNNLTMGLMISLDRDRYINEYRAPPIPKKMNLDSQFGACFRGCLAYVLRRLEARGQCERLNIVFEYGHKNVGDCQRIFMDLRRRYLAVGSDLLGTFTVSTKDGCAPLMVADMLAHTYSMVDLQRRTGMPVGTLEPPIDEKGELAILQLKPDGLMNLKKGFERLRQMEIEEWRSKRDARRASLLPSKKQPS